ncbi:MAG: type II secretion system major pseudopilin GspG [Candidatus Muiribacteriota bacterium]
MKFIKNKHKFTVHGVTFVIILLVILAIFVVPALVGRSNDAKTVKAKSDMQRLETALKLYKLDIGKYPTTEQGLNVLINPPKSEDEKKWREKGYLDKKNLPKDPWNNEYLYFSPGLHGDYNLFSYGADGQPGGKKENADISTTAVYSSADKIDAFTMSKVLVKKKLKAPSTAKFCSYSNATVIKSDNGRFKVSAYVDADNSFGAQIRTSYTCILKESGGKWTLESINM